MNTIKLLSVAQLSKLMNETYDWEAFAKFLFHNGVLVFDSRDEIKNERESIYEYKGRYWEFTRENGEIIKVGRGTEKPSYATHWNDKGITYLVKTTKLPLGTINANVKYFIEGN